MSSDKVSVDRQKLLSILLQVEAALEEIRALKKQVKKP